jgi:hypothetical protein
MEVYGGILNGCTTTRVYCGSRSPQILCLLLVWLVASSPEQAREGMQWLVHKSVEILVEDGKVKVYNDDDDSTVSAAAEAELLLL